MTHPDDLIAALRAAIAATPDNAALRKHLGDLLFAAGDYHAAEVEFRRALDLSPQDVETKRCLAVSFLQQGKLDLAQVVLEEVLRSAQETPAICLLAARVYLQSGDLTKAQSLYQRAVQADPALAEPGLAAQLQQGAAAVAAPQTPMALPARGTTGEPAAPKVKVPLAGEDSGAQPEVERPQLTFEDVGGMDALKDEIRMKIIHPLNNPEIFRAYGKKIGGGILMYGPPGCGKTHLARATAGEVKARFLAIGIHDVLDMYLGQSEQNLHAIFDLARVNTPCILFFDEVDALGGNRRDYRQSAGRQVINQLLAEMDGANGNNEGVLILAATNAPWFLDPALRRPGRFDRVLFVPPPDEPARSAILRILLASKPTEPLDYNKLARETAGFSGADLKGMVDVAVERKLDEAMRRGKPLPLSTRDLQEAAKQIKASTREWFASARNYALFSNQGGIYDDVLDYIRRHEATGLLGKLNLRGGNG